MITVSTLLTALPFPASVVDAEGIVVDANAALGRLVDSGPEALIGQGLFDALGIFGGIREAQDATLRGFPAETFEETFPLTRTAASSPAVERFRLRLKAFAQESKIYAIALVEEIAADEALSREVHDLEHRLAQVRSFKHDISNTLMGVMGHSELLKETPDLPESARHRAGRLLDQCQKVREAVESISYVLGSRGREDD